MLRIWEFWFYIYFLDLSKFYLRKIILNSFMFTYVNMLHNNLLLGSVKMFTCLCYFRYIFGQLFFKLLNMYFCVEMCITQSKIKVFRLAWTCCVIWWLKVIYYLSTNSFFSKNLWNFIDTTLRCVNIQINKINMIWFNIPCITSINKIFVRLKL
jgi:hypothetical protein